jgi:hypothetical protein
MSAFHDREFDTYVVLGDRERPDLWTWSVWPVVAEALSPLVKSQRGRAAVRTSQFERDGETLIRFGRIGWNELGHEKWVHGSPKNNSVSAGWRFLDAEIWAPAWSTCERDGRAPDLFVGIRNERFWPQAEESVSFNPVVLLAVATDLGEPFTQEAVRAVQAVSAHTIPVLAVHQRRRWGKAFGNFGFSDSIQDLLSTGLFRVGSPHTRPVDETTFAEATWRRIGGAGG